MVSRSAPRRGWRVPIVIATGIAGLGLMTVPAAVGDAAMPTMGGIVPEPVAVHPTPGIAYSIVPRTVIEAERGNPDAVHVGNYLAGLLRAATGFALPVVPTGSPRPAGAITLTLSEAPPTVGQEGYVIDADESGVSIRALTGAGWFHGVQSLRQLLPAVAGSTAGRSAIVTGPWLVPGGHILDYPRFGYRGAMVDVSRHFFGVADIERYIDAISLYKINVIHLHLSDDQGWRIAISTWPRLATHGGSTEVGGGPGGYYTAADYTEIVNYAKQHHMTVVPEIDMPGHVNAALASYGKLNCDGIAEPLYTGTNVGFSSLCVPKPVTYAFVNDVMAELAALTPGPYLHFGGDEAQSTTPAHYDAFVPRVQEIIQANGKTAMGWHNIVSAPLSQTTIAEFWGTTRQDPGVAAATRRGTRLVMAPADLAYLDMKYNPETPLGQNWAGYIPVHKAYDWDPGNLIARADPAAVLGVEGPVWTETMSTLAEIEYMAFPRLPALAELAWSPWSTHDWNRFRVRLGAQGPLWSQLGINYYHAPEIPWK